MCVWAQHSSEEAFQFVVQLHCKCISEKHSECWRHFFFNAYHINSRYSWATAIRANDIHSIFILRAPYCSSVIPRNCLLKSGFFHTECSLLSASVVFFCSAVTAVKAKIWFLVEVCHVADLLCYSIWWDSSGILSRPHKRSTLSCRCCSNVTYFLHSLAATFLGYISDLKLHACTVLEFKRKIARWV